MQAQAFYIDSWEEKRTGNRKWKRTVTQYNIDINFPNIQDYVEFDLATIDQENQTTFSQYCNQLLPSETHQNSFVDILYFDRDLTNCQTQYNETLAIASLSSIIFLLCQFLFKKK